MKVYIVMKQSPDPIQGYPFLVDEVDQVFYTEDVALKYETARSKFVINRVNRYQERGDLKRLEYWSNVQYYTITRNVVKHLIVDGEEL